MADQQPQGGNGGANGLNLPPGFRFHPSDEEIITSYLQPKVFNPEFTSVAIAEADLNKSEPWELPLLAKMGEDEWYFYCQKDRKYPTGHRANRATEAGYWKATGKDKEILHDTSPTPVIIGTKKTLVFYKGRAPRGDKTNWVMHEYKLPYHDVWVVCRVFHKCAGIKKAPAELAPAPAPAYDDISMARDDLSFPMPTKFPNMVQEGFTMDPSASTFYSNNGVTSSVPPALSGMLRVNNVGLPMMNTSHFGNMTAPSLPPPVSFYQQQVGIGTSSNSTFMAGPDSRPTSVLSHDVRVSPDQASASEISSVVTAPVAAGIGDDMDDSIWNDY